ncbi:MAG TPA: alkaline phosphatase family protein [Sphingomicrobium sp.]|nr:alkaline phosphatase family protein [Sphingomicrobium sp.]
MRKFLLAAAAVLCSTTATAQPAPAPKLIVAIAVDQFSADLYDQYRPHFTAGLRRLSSGTVFRNGYQAQNATETCPGHSTILTGTYPARNGIIANTWFDLTQQRDDKGVYCAEDERVPGSSTTAYTVSPYHLLAPTLGDRLKQARPASRNVAVSGKDRGAVMMSGHDADQRWYWVNNKFVTDLKGKPVPQAVTRGNAAIAAALAAPRPPLELPPLCQAKAKPVAIENSEKKVGTGAFARNEQDAAAFRASPELDGATLAVAAALVDELQLGRQADPDVLSISLSATDYVGHTYGSDGSEMCLQMLALDRELGDFLKFLDGRGIDYSVLLTADHGGLDIPERQRGAGHPDAARVDPNLNAGKVGLQIVQELGLPGFGLYGEGSFGDMYVDRSLTEEQRKLVLAKAVAAFRAHPQVEAVFTGEQLAATPVATTPPDQWTLIQRARASYFPGRSGDLVVLLKRNITPISDTSRYVATHGSAWDYDRRVPILFWRQGMAPSERNDAVSTVDIMPTLAASLGLAVDQKSIDGECLSGISTVVCPPR